MSQHHDYSLEHDHEYQFEVTFLIEPERFPHDREPETIAAEIKSRIESVLAPWSINPMAIEISGRCLLGEAFDDGRSQVAEFGRRLVEQLRPEMNRRPLDVIAAVADIASTPVPASTRNVADFQQWIVDIFARHGIEFDGAIIGEIVADMEMVFPGAKMEPEIVAVFEGANPVNWGDDDHGMRIDVMARHVLKMIHSAVESPRSEWPFAVESISRQMAEFRRESGELVDDDRFDDVFALFTDWLVAFISDDPDSIPPIDAPLVDVRSNL